MTLLCVWPAGACNQVHEVSSSLAYVHEELACKLLTKKKNVKISMVHIFNIVKWNESWVYHWQYLLLLIWSHDPFNMYQDLSIVEILQEIPLSRLLIRYRGVGGHLPQYFCSNTGTHWWKYHPTGAMKCEKWSQSEWQTSKNGVKVSHIPCKKGSEWAITLGP